MKSRLVRRTRHPRVEQLLQRVLLSVSVVKETLSIEGTAGKDEIVIGVHPQVINLMSVKVNGDEKVFLLGSFKVININALAGNDRVRIGELYDAHPAYLNIDLGPGNDRADGSPHAETIIGGSGNDRVSAGAGNDFVNAGAGDDVVVGDAGNDSIIGLDGNDTIYGGDGIDSISSGEGEDSINGGNQADWIFAAGGNDRIVETETRQIDARGQSTDSGNFIDAGDGNDYVEAVWNSQFSGKNDTVRGGRGDDYLFDHGDYVSPSGANISSNYSVLLSGDDGNDRLIGYNCAGDAGDDRIVTPSLSRNVDFHGGDGDDLLINEFQMNGGFITGDAGEDVIQSKSIAVAADGGAGNDKITSDYSMQGGEGDDLLRTWVGLVPSPFFMVGLRNDGGAGNDTIWGSPYPDSLVGGDGSDVLFGFEMEDSLDGGAGSDKLYGGSGDDTLHGGDGNDSLFGGDANDRKRSDDGHDDGYGDGGKDWFDPEHDWALTDSSSRDQNVITPAPPTHSSIYYGGSTGYSGMLSLAQHYNYTPADPNAPSIAEPMPALMFLSNAAILAGTNYAITALTSSEVQLPELTVKERKAVTGQFVHLPSDWSLERMGKKGGLVWYRIRQGGKEFGLAKGKLLNPLGMSHSLSSESQWYGSDPNNIINFDDLLELANQYGSGATSGGVVDTTRKTLSNGASMGAYVIGLHPATTILTDGAAGERDVAVWKAAQPYNAVGLVTRPSLRAIRADSGATIAFKQPSPDLLDSVSLDKGKKYLFSSGGILPITADGIGIA